MRNPLKLVGCLILAGAVSFVALPLPAKETGTTTGTTASHPLHYSYHHLLPLEGGSNFRDLGGYRTRDGKNVVRGELFRSGVMSGLTESDMAYLDQFHFRTVVDLRTSDEIRLFPNHWADSHNIEQVSYDYGFEEIAKGAGNGNGPAVPQNFSMESLYRNFPVMLKPQLKMYFDQLLAHKTPLVVNCSAGQDRTGTASALLLTALGVPRDIVVEDYLLSTDYRSPVNEMKGADPDQSTDNNGFARMMLRYKKNEGKPRRARVLKTEEGIPYITFVFDQLEKDYGSVETYLDQELGVDKQDIAKLRSLYLN